MTTLSIKDVPEKLAERLRQRAAGNHRSLQGELMAIIEQAVLRPQPPAPPPVSRPAVIGPGWGGRPVFRRGDKTIEELAAEHRVRFPQPIRSGPLAVDIIRAHREARDAP